MNYRARGKPGNRGRTGMPKPPGSGRPRISTDPVLSLTIRVDEADRCYWKTEALKRHISVGALIREAMAEYLDY